MDGNSYRCYTLPQYDSPFVETETIMAHVIDAPATGILMTGQQEDYWFSLYFAYQKLHYEASRNDITIVSISTTMGVRDGTVEVRRTVNSVAIIVNQQTLAMENIVMEDFGFVRFTEICVGGGLLISLQKNMYLHVCTLVVHMMYICWIIFTTYALCNKYDCKYEVMQI